MIIESHWKNLKHDYLHRINRPRVDFVAWVLATRVLPDRLHKLDLYSGKIKRLGIGQFTFSELAVGFQQGSEGSGEEDRGGKEPSQVPHRSRTVCLWLREILEKSLSHVQAPRRLFQARRRRRIHAGSSTASVTNAIPNDPASESTITSLCCCLNDGI